jgi:uncharacterized membrane-anchored protein YhcB (DUF1043 family)
MNNNHSSRFFDGFILGIMVGALGVFLLGTKSGKNLLKIISEQGLDGVKDLIDEYNLQDETDFEDEVDFVEKVHNATPEVRNHVAEKNNNSAPEIVESEEKPTPKKRFFKRLRR